MNSSTIDRLLCTVVVVMNATELPVIIACKHFFDIFENSFLPSDYIRTCMQDLQSELTSSDASTSRKRKRPKQIVESYHAGLPASRRRTIQNQFMSGALRIVVATIAFGRLAVFHIPVKPFDH